MILRTWLAVMVSLAGVTTAEVIPSAPTNHFTDQAGVVSKATCDQLDRRLADFERETSNQVVVAVLPRMASDSSIEDYSHRVFQKWGVGLKGLNNGALLLVFIEDRKMRIEVGYGLEGVLPDALCKRIIEDEIKPHFKAGHFDAGLTAGVEAMLLATRGEYKGRGHTVHEQAQSSGNGIFTFWWFIFMVVILLSIVRRAVRVITGGTLFDGSGSWSGSNRSGGGWSSGGSGWSGGGGGGFSGGGGSSGGGGASGGW